MSILNLNDSFEESLTQMEDSAKDLFELNDEQITTENVPEQAATSCINNEKRGVKRHIATNAKDNVPIPTKKYGAKKIETYVFLDFETTGLFQDNSRERPTYNPTDPRDLESIFEQNIHRGDDLSFPRIVEFALVGVRRSDFQLAINKFKTKQTKSDYMYIPRSVYSTQLNYELGGSDLTNHLLKIKPCNALSNTKFCDYRNLRDEWPGIKHFLTGLKKPICFAAHNGLAFDFPILLAELKRCEIDIHEFFADSYFADTLYAFRSIDCDFQNNLNSILNAIDFSMLRHLTVAEMDGNMKTPEKPVEKVVPRSAPPAMRNIVNDQLPEDHPYRFLKTKSSWPFAMRIRYNPHFIQKVNGSWVLKMGDYRRENNTHSQPILYKKIFNEEFCAHTAVNDCEALLRICLAFEDSFINYMDKFSTKLFANCFQTERL